MRKILITCSFLTVFLGYAQLFMQQLQIKTPQSYAFEKYGNVPVNMYTGMLDMRIPLYNLSIDGENSIDVLLSYDSSGFMPHKKSDLGGLGWSLIAGGRITRSVNRMPDEYRGDPGSNGGNPFDSGANLNGFLTGVRLNSYTNTQVYNLNGTAGGLNGLDWRLGPIANGYESEPDSFNFNILGLSGKFMIGNDGKVLVESSDPNITVDVSGIQSYGATDNNCKLTPSQIVMKDGKGNTYYFGGDFSKYEVSYIVPSYNGTTNNLTQPYYTINAWSISRIDFANGKKVTFKYVTDTLGTTFCQKDIGSTQAANAKILSLDDYVQDGSRSGVVRNCVGGIIGCVNSSSSAGSSNENYIMLKKSLLESINFDNKSIFINYKDIGYPIVHNSLATKFFNEFLIDYISLKYNNTTVKNYQFNYVDYGGTNKRPFLKTIIETISNAQYSFEYNNTGNLPFYYTDGIDHWGFWNGKDNNTNLLAFDTYNTVTGDYTLNNTTRDPNTSLYNIGLLSKITYPTKGYSVFEYEPQSYGQRIERNSTSAFLPTLTSNSGNIGGARIKRQYDYSENGGIIDDKSYQYTTTLNGTSSSGILMNWPRYLYYFEFKDDTYYQNLFINSSSNVQQNSMDSYNIGYSKVYEIDKNKGYIEHSFTSYQDTPDVLTPDTSNIRNYFVGTYPSYPENLYKNFRNLYGNDRSILRGKPLIDSIYDNNGNLSKRIEYQYNDNVNYNPNSLQDDNNYLSINHLSGYWVQGYKKYFNNSTLKKIITTDFLNGHSVVNTTDYFYDSNFHLNLSREENTLADNTVFSKNYKYVEDLSPAYPNLLSGNMLGVPLETDSFKNGKPISKLETIYPTYLPTAQTGNLLLPLSVQSTQTNTISSAVPPTGETKTTEITYDQYDISGNLLQYTTKAGIPTAIIWGYNSTQPIAKIEGATYAQVSNLATALISASDADIDDASQNTLITDLDNLRNDPAMANYQITTYTYDPLIGVTSITPPSGIREIYKYDTANRLQSVTDVNGKVLKEFKYNYKN